MFADAHGMKLFSKLHESLGNLSSRAMSTARFASENSVGGFIMQYQGLTALTLLPTVVVWVVHLRVLINGITFMSVATALAWLTVRVANTSEARLLLETEVSHR